MTTTSTPTPLTRARETIARLRAELAEARQNQPIAVVGVGLRLPGGIDTLDGFWQALVEGRDLVRTMPPGRLERFADQWAGLQRRGGFLEEVLEFDAAFFGISPREARAMDPQHRLLLEVAWEALEHAGMPPKNLRQARTGLYVGISHQDYRDWEPADADGYWATGNGHCFAAGRVAYALGLNGPAVAVDTACSSSLVAIHQAAVALRRGECDVALAGGVNLILSPRSTRLLGQEMGALAPDGLCKAFDASANGFARGEGCGLLVLKRLDAAVRDGDAVLAVLKGSAINQDGRSSGFTAPSALAQVAVIEAALADAQLTPADIGMVETHGTGTALGDPIEMEALVAALGRDRGDRPLYLGAVKTNLGHLEAAAGVAGAIKAILSLRAGTIPPLVHFRTLNPRIDLGGAPFVLPTSVLPWRAAPADRYAGVSSFGMSGTNAHVVFGAVEPASSPAAGDVSVVGFELSARSPEALRELAARYAGRLRQLPAEQYPAFAYTATSARGQHRWRARVTAADPATAVAALTALAEGTESAAVAVTEGEFDTPLPPLPRQVVELPHYPWQRRRYAPTPPADASATPSSDPVAPAVSSSDAVGSAESSSEPVGFAVAAESVAPPAHRLVWRPLSFGAATVAAAGSGEDSGAVAPSASHPTGGSGAGPAPADQPGDGCAPADWLDRRVLVLAGDDAELVERLASVAGDAVVPNPLPADEAGWEAFWAAHPEPARLVLAMAAPPLPDTVDGEPGTLAETGAALCAAVTLAVRCAPANVEVVALTRGARRVHADDRVPATGHGLLHGLAPVLGLEFTTWRGIVDLPATPADDDLAALLRALPEAAGVGEDLLAVRDGRALAARIEPAPDGYRPELPVRPDGAYLVTGGLGGVGRAIVADLVRRGARRLALIGRRPWAELPKAATELVERLRADGVEVRYHAADCDDPAALAAVLADTPGLAGVVHAAGTLPRTPLATAGVAEFAAALRGKFTGAWWLHLLLRDRKLDFFLTVSSVSALWGTDGYGAYAAANGGVDLVACHRAGTGVAATSVQFGPWAVDGMVDAAAMAGLERGGLTGLTPQAGCAALTAVAPGPEPVLVACEVRWDRFTAVMSARRHRALYATVLAAPSGSVSMSSSGAVSASAATAPASPAGTGASSTGVEAGEVPPGRRELLELPELARVAAAGRRIAAAVGRILGYDEDQTVRDDEGFFDLGLDSMMAVDLLTELTATFGVRLQVADIFDHPTVAALAELVVSRLCDAPAPAPGASARTADTGSDADAARDRGGSRGIAVSERAGSGRTRELAVSQPAAGASSTSSGDFAPAPDPTEPGDPDDRAVAIIGMAGRFPGADSVEELWELLLSGRDGVGPVPADRWSGVRYDADPMAIGAIATDQGGFLRDIASFDAPFFTMAAREAESLDPQHRLLLETSWHALEDASIDPTRLNGSRTGVFVGISNSDYARVLERGGLDGLDAYFGTGTALNAAAGRIAYLLGLRGPALAVDTACSSSLVAIHLAIRSLRSGESELALAGGVNVIAAPTASVAVSRAHMLSPTGRCQTFSANADGFVRAEAVAMLVLKPLAAARRDGDRILAVLRGSAVNSDGASSGLTVPNGQAQQEVITAALADTGLAPADISYLEAHGTGTSLGDPVEVEAAWRVLGQGRAPGEPLRIGSVKSNVGHAESAAGVVGVIKTVLSLRHNWLPGNLHCTELNPYIPWSEMNVRVVDAGQPWRGGGRPRRAGVSAFGFSGTNAHVIVEEAPPAPTASVEAAEAAGPWLLPISAPDADGLARLSAAWDATLAEASEAELPALTAAAGAGRAHLPVRRAVVGRSVAELREALAKPPRSTAPTRQPRVGFLFSGQGSQYFGMGRTLYETEPVFRATFDACAEVLEPALGAPLTDLLWYGQDRERLNQTAVTQPALVALELSLAELWASWGVRASVVLGHSVGEVAAAIYAGVLDLADGLTLIAHRARLMQSTAPGAMLAVSAPLEKVTEWLAGTTLDVAAVNGPEAVVVAGVAEQIEAFAAARKADGVRTQRLVVSHAFHSRLMEPILPELAEAIGGLTYRAPKLPIVANVTGRLAGADEYDADYWCRHVRQPVRFLQGVEQMRELGVDVLLEIGPSRTLASLVDAAGLAPAGGTLSSLRRGVADRAVLLEAVRGLYEQGQRIDWAAVRPPLPGRPAAAPRYPFARIRYWARPAETAGQVDVPHWGRELRSPALRERVFSFPRSARFPAYLTDHRLYGTVVTPAASHLATILSALAGDGRPLAIADLVCPRALVITDEERYEVQLVVGADGRLGVHSLVDAERGEWQQHLGARLVQAGASAVPVPDRQAFIASAERHLTGEEFYEYFRRLGYTLGPSFRWIGDVWLRGDEALVRYQRPKLPDDPGAYQIYPGLIDSLFQSIAGFMVDEQAEEAESLAIPFTAATLAFPGRPPADGGEVWGHVRVRAAQPLPRGRRRVEAADLHMFTADGRSVVVAEDFRVRHAPRHLLRQSLRAGQSHLYRLDWVPAEPAGELPAPGYRIALRTGGSDVNGLAEALRALGCVLVGQVAEADAVVDCRYREADPMGAAVELAATLRDAPLTKPYAVICPDGAQAAPLREALWGMLATVEAEEPTRRLLRVTAEPGAAVAEPLLRSLAAGVPEPRMSIVDGQVRVARLVPARVPEGGCAGGVLITGGLGALGLSVARMVAELGASDVTLMGRSAPDEQARRVIDELTGRGVRVTVVRGDVADPDDCARAVATASEHAPLRTVFHLAGAIADGAMATLTERSFATVFGGKVGGAEQLAAALAGRQLEAFVLFSSISSVLGSVGQANYAAANGCLNGMAERLRAQGVPAVALALGPWEPDGKAGMAANATVRAAAERLGVSPLRDAQAAPLVAAALAATEPLLVAVALDVPRYAEAVAGHPRATLVSELADGTAAAAGAGAAGAGPAELGEGWLRERLRQVDPAEREEQLSASIRGLVAQTLGAGDAIDDTRGFADLGLDSIMAIDLRSKLSHAIGLDLPATVAFDHPTVRALATYVRDQVLAEPAAPPAPAPASGATSAAPSAAAVSIAEASMVDSSMVDPDELSLEELLRAVREDLAREP